MNIREDLKSYLDSTGTTPAKLARQARIPVNVITRFIKGERSGIHSTTVEKLWPFLYGDRPPSPPEPKEAA
jgi:hypothetical protein